MKFFDLVLASTDKWGIGKNNEVPWKIKEDMKFFKNLTTKSSVYFYLLTFMHRKERRMLL